MVWLLIEWEIHVGGVLHHSSPPSTKRLWHISPEAPTASPLLSVHNLMVAVTAQLIHDGPLSSIPITSFPETLLIYMLDCTLTRCWRFLPSSGKWWKTFWNGLSGWMLLLSLRLNMILYYERWNNTLYTVWPADLWKHVQEQDTRGFKDHNLHHHRLWPHIHSWLDWASQVGGNMLDNWTGNYFYQKQSIVWEMCQEWCANLAVGVEGEWAERTALGDAVFDSLLLTRQFKVQFCGQKTQWDTLL